MKNHTLRPRPMLKFITLFLSMVIIARVKTEQCSEKGRNYILSASEGSSLLPGEIISGHNVEHPTQINCNFLCYKEPKCVAFNFRTSDDDKHAINCQLSNSTRKKTNRDGDWTFFHDVDAEIRYENERKKPYAVSGTTCASLYKSGVRKDGIYTINPDGLGSFQVRCDMTTDGGGWTVFQRRQDGSEDFYREWSDYKAGFGDLRGEFWLGLDKIHRLTKSGQKALRVDLMNFNNAIAYAKYGTFTVASESDSYKLRISSFSGTAGDSLIYHNGINFTTKDRDNDQWSTKNYAVVRQSAWWYKSCCSSDLNARYWKQSESTKETIYWHHWKNYYGSIKKTEMKTRPAQF